MNLFRSMPVAGLLAALALGAHAQSTLGELIDRGAVKVTPGEIAGLGDLRVLRRAADADAFITLRADGTVAGIVHNKQGAGSSEAVGTWTVDAAGRRCAHVQLPAFGMTMEQCGYVYRLGKAVYGARSDERQALVSEYLTTAFLQ